MKKWILLASLLLTAVSSLDAQILIALIFGSKLNSGKMEFGLVGGPVLSDLSNLPNSSSKFGFNLGMYFDIRLSDRFLIHPELIAKGSFGANKLKPYPVGDPGVDSLFANGSVKRKLNAFSLPLGIRYRIAGDFFLEAGPQADWIIKAFDEFTTGDHGGHLTNQVNINAQITMLDIGMFGGIVYKVRKVGGFGVGLRYYLGLTDVDKYNLGNQSNREWLLNVYIPIGAAKAKKNQEAKAASSSAAGH